MYCRSGICNYSGIPWGALGGSKITYCSAGGIPLPTGDMCHVSLLGNGLLFVHMAFPHAPCTADNYVCVHWRVWKYSNTLLTRHVCVCVRASHSGLTVSVTRHFFLDEFTIQATDLTKHTRTPVQFCPVV